MGHLNFLGNKRTRLALLIVFLLAYLVQAMSIRHKGNEWRMTLDSAMSALDAGDYEKAEERFFKVFENSKNDFKDPQRWVGFAGLHNVYCMQGIKAHENGEYEKGQELLLKALAIHRDVLTQFPERCCNYPTPSPRDIDPATILRWLSGKALLKGRLEEAEYYVRTSIAVEEMQPGFQHKLDGPPVGLHEMLQCELGNVLREQEDVHGLEFLIEQCQKWGYSYALETLEPELKELKSRM